jgi:hypothetical protein
VPAWRKAGSAFRTADDKDPLLGLINLFDASMVLVVAMLVALAGKGSMAEVAARLSQQDVTIVTNPGKADMEMVIKRGNKIEKLRATAEQGRGAGQRLGTAYRLESGEVVYVPEGGAK